MALRYGYFDSEIVGYDSEGMPILDRAESSDLLCLIFAGLLTNGVLANPNDCFRIMEDEGMRLKIKAGFGLIKGHFAYDDEDSEIWISDAPRSYKRIDAVVLRLNNRERKCEIIVKEGTPATKPVAPELIKSIAGDYYELCLAEVLVNPNQIAITQSNIKDTRADSSKCGFITQLIDSIDTSVFFAQLNSFYDEFVLKSDMSYDEFLSWAEEKKAEIVAWQGKEEAEVDAWQAEQAEAFDGLVQTFAGQWESWFQNIRDQLSEDAAGNLQNEVNSITAVLREISEEEIDAIINGTYKEDKEGGVEPDVYSRISSGEIEGIVDNAFGKEGEKTK